VKISQINSCLCFCYAILGLSLYFMIGVFSSLPVEYLPKTNLAFDVISEDLLSFPDTLQYQVCPELPHCVTFRLFASVFTKILCLRHYSYAVSDPISNWFSVLVHFRSCCLYSDYSIIS
jgi:hypothetical protein